MKYNVSVMLPLTLWVEVDTDNPDEAIEKAKAIALETPEDQWGDDFSQAEFNIVND